MMMKYLLENCSVLVQVAVELTQFVSFMIVCHRCITIAVSIHGAELPFLGLLHLITRFLLFLLPMNLLQVHVIYIH